MAGGGGGGWGRAPGRAEPGNRTGEAAWQQLAGHRIWGVERTFRTRRGACSRLALEAQDGVPAATSLCLSHPTVSQFLNHAQHLPARVAERAGGQGPLGHTPANTS